MNFIISHLLRAPVANLLGLTAVFKDVKDDPGMAEEIIGKIGEVAKHLDKILKSLNDILKEEEGVGNKMELIDLDDIIGKIEEHTVELNYKFNLIIRCNFNKDLQVYSCRSYIYSIFKGLIINVFACRNEGKSRQVLISSKKYSGKVELLFLSHLWIPEFGSQQNIFLSIPKYFDISKSEIGMHLYLIKLLVEALQGTITGLNKPQTGTAFLIKLPVLSFPI